MPPTQAPPDDDVAVCPGCGGKNPKGSTECDWCGRPFLTSGGRLRLTIWQVVSSLLLLGLIGAVAALAILNAGRALPSARASASTATLAPTVVPTPAVTPRVTVAATSTPLALIAGPPTPEPTPSEPPTPEPTATPQLQQAKIANTNGQGVTVRDQPGPTAARAGVLREGTVVFLTGNDQTVAARPWREIETADHSLKGWVQGDFLQSVPASP